DSPAAEQATGAAAGAVNKTLHSVAPRMATDRGGRDAAPPQKTVEVVQETHTLEVRRAERDAERDRHLRAVLDIVGHVDGKMQALARLQVEDPRLAVKLVLEDHVAVGAVVETLQLLRGDPFAIELVDDLVAADLQEEVVLRVHVIRRHRAGRRDEDE